MPIREKPNREKPIREKPVRESESLKGQRACMMAATELGATGGAAAEGDGGACRRTRKV